MMLADGYAGPVVAVNEPDATPSTSFFRRGNSQAGAELTLANEFIDQAAGSSIARTAPPSWCGSSSIVPFAREMISWLKNKPKPPAEVDLVV